MSMSTENINNSGYVLTRRSHRFPEFGIDLDRYNQASGESVLTGQRVRFEKIDANSCESDILQLYSLQMNNAE